MPPRPAPAVVVVSADTPWADHDGNTFIVPAGWKVATLDTLTVLTSPEGNSHVALFDTAAADNEAARDAGWKAYNTDAKWPLLDTSATSRRACTPSSRRRARPRRSAASVSNRATWRVALG